MKTELTPTAASLLGFLHDAPLTGRELSSKAQTVIGDFWSLTTSQVYSELKKLQAEGFIDKEIPTARRQVKFVLTKSGRNAFLSWIANFQWHETIRMPMLFAVNFGEYIEPAILKDKLDEFRREHTEKLEYYHSLESKPLSRYQKATLDFGIRYEKAVQDWLENVSEIIKGE